MNKIQLAITESLADTCQNLWFPKLTPLLANYKWAELQSLRSINKSNYVIESFLNSQTTHNEPIARLQVNDLPLYEVPRQLICHVGNGKSYSIHEILNSNVIDCLERSYALLNTEPTLKSSLDF